jgi:hypothetical protein
MITAIWYVTPYSLQNKKSLPLFSDIRIAARNSLPLAISWTDPQISISRYESLTEALNISITQGCMAV